MKPSITRTFLVLVASTCVLVSCGTDDAQQSAIQGDLVVDVDNEVYQLLDSVSIKFMASQPRMKVKLRSVSARDAFRNLFSHASPAVVMARDYTVDETASLANSQRKPYPRALLAHDALVFYTNTSFPYDTMSSEHISMWLRGEMTEAQWKAMYPLCTSIPSFTVPDPNNSVYGNVVRLVTKGAVPDRLRLRMLPAREDIVREAHKGTGIIGVGYLSQFVKDTSVKMLRLSYLDTNGQYEHPRPVHAGYLIQKQYPYPVPIHVIVRDALSQSNPATGFLQYASRDGNAQRVFFNAGIHPAYATIVLNLPE